MPLVGLGTFLSKDPEELEKVVISAILEHGYRHIDTAQGYGNEHIIGKALQHCFAQGIKREDLFITTKIFPTNTDRAEEVMKQSLVDLQIDYVDLVLVHWMVPKMNEGHTKAVGPGIHQLWPIFESFVERGWSRSIGVSNCNVQVFL